MLPLLRIIPAGGVCLAVLILLLAISPPRDTGRGAAPEMILARGALIDRRQHPEWPQFVVQAAFRRAGEILSLRDLPNTPTLFEPVALPPPRPVIAAVPAAEPPSVAVGAAPPAKPADPGAKPTDNAAAAAPAPQPASDGAVTRTATLTADVDDGKNTKAEPAVAPKPATTPALADSMKPPQPATATVAAPAPPAAAEALTKVAVLPVERPATDPDPDDVTGSIDSAAGSTIPVEIGETSSTELPIVLPRERPPILSTRERNSRGILHKRAVRHARNRGRPRTGVRPAVASNVQPASEVNLFEALFDTRSAAAAKPPARGKGATATSTGANPPPYPPTVFYPFSSK